MRAERQAVEAMIIDRPDKKAHEIAREIGTDPDYVKSVRTQLRKKGKLLKPRQATDEERLEDLRELFDKRHGKMSRKAAAAMLMHHCYYMFRSQDDDIHAKAIEETYALNDRLQNPFPIQTAIQLCEDALGFYMQSINTIMNEKAKELGYPGAGLHYSDRAIIDKWEIKESELPLVHLGK